MVRISRRAGAVPNRGSRFGVTGTSTRDCELDLRKEGAIECGAWELSDGPIGRV